MDAKPLQISPGLKYILYALVVVFMTSACTPILSIEKDQVLEKTFQAQSTRIAELSTQVANNTKTDFNQWEAISYISTQMPYALDWITPIPEGVTITPTAWIGPAYSPDVRTGISEIDQVIEVFWHGSPSERSKFVSYQYIPCGEPEGLGDIPRCEEDEEIGTLVKVFPVLYSEGVQVREKSIEGLLDFPIIGLFAVYYVPEDAYRSEEWPAGEIAIFFTSPSPDATQFVTVHVSNGKVVRLEFTPANRPGIGLWPGYTEFILPPLIDVNPTPAAVCTPPACTGDEVHFCPGKCPGGCGTICATPTANSVD